MIARPWLRYLFFLARRDELRAMPWRVFLGPALVGTWLAGMGRYWDHPSAGLLQMLGVGSVIYVFVLAALLWGVIVPLRPRRWSYPEILMFVCLTSPPALLYALPVERWMSLQSATLVNTWFLAIVASWRVGLLVFVLRRFAALNWSRTIVGALLPLVGIVMTLMTLNLEKAVFEIMAGRRPGLPPTSNDGAYRVLVLLTLLSPLAAVPLLFAYFVIVLTTDRESRARL
jgi:hypothetical protein